MASNKDGSQSSNGGGQSHPLSHPDDRRFLTDILCLVRSQLEVFVLSADLSADLRYRQMAGKVDFGRVGIRCIHCTRGSSGSRGVGGSRLPSASISRNGAVSYPKSIRLLKESVQNYQRFHFMACPSIPDEVRKQYQALKSTGKRQKSGNASTKYWEDSCRRMGMMDTATGIKLQTGSFLPGEERNDATTISGEPTKAESAAIGKGNFDKSEAVSNESPQLENETAVVAKESMPPVHHLCSDRQPALSSQKMCSDGNSTDNPQRATADVGAGGPRRSDLLLDDTRRGTSPGLGESLPLSDQGLVLRDETTEQVGMSPPRQSSAIQSAAQESISLGSGHGGSCTSQMLANQQENAVSVTAGAIGLSTLLHRNHSPHLSETSQQSIALEATQVFCGPSFTQQGSLAQSSMSTKALLERVQLAVEVVQATLQIRPVSSREEAGTEDSFGMQQQEVLDLPSLGAELYELFTGQNPLTPSENNSESRVCESIAPTVNSMESAFTGAEDMTHQRRKRERRRETEGIVPLSDLGLPAALCCIVSSLMDYQLNGQCNNYESIEEVAEDLRLIAAEPEQYLFRGAACDLRICQDVLYGRDDEISLLIKTFDDVTSAKSSANKMVLVSGYSGTGKSSLIGSVQRSFVERGACFVSGKFDAMPQPLSAIVSALDDYCNLLAQSADRIDTVRDAVAAAIGSEGKALASLIPNLKKIINFGDGPPSQISGREALQRLLFMFRMLFWATCSRTNPVVLFLDDLQWADEVSLELMQILVTDTMIDGLLFVGCYRDNEVGLDHPLMARLDSIRHSHSVSIIPIHTTNLDSRSVNCLVSNSLQLTPRQTRSLSEVVLNKTGGNALFAVQFLASLHDEGLLRFSLTSRRWEWDIDQIRNKDIADNVVELMTAKLLRLAPEVQEALSVVASFGAKCQESLLCALDRAPDRVLSTVAALDVAVAEGLMVKTKSVYRFSHDQIQCASYLLIPESERRDFHLSIGRSLWKLLSAEEMERYLLVVVDQLHRGSSLITDNKEKIMLAHLSLRAGEMASSLSAFLPALAYLKAGVGLLSNDDWQCHRELCFDLHNLCAETENVLGDFDSMHSHLNKMLTKGETFQEKLRAYYTLVQSLGAQGRTIDAINTAIAVLNQLGETLPDAATDETVTGEMRMTMRMLSAENAEDEKSLLSLTTMEDAGKQHAMRFLHELIFSIYSHGRKREYYPVPVCRMVRLSMQHGVSKESALGFAAYGIIQCGALGNYNSGYRYGKIALSIIDRFQAKEYVAKVYVPVYGIINHWTEPIQSCLPPLKHAIKVGLATGDTEQAMVAAHIYDGVSFGSGKSLGPLWEELEIHSQQMMSYNQLRVHMNSKPLRQVVLNLLGHSANPIAMAGEEMDEETRSLPEQTAYLTHSSESWLAYMFGEYRLAWDARNTANKIRTGKNFDMLIPVGCYNTFYSCLTALALARMEEKTEYCETVDKTMAQMTVWARSTPWNCQNKLELMNAEYAYLKGDFASAVKCYELSIELAVKHRFVHEQALALERCGIFHLENGNHSTACNLFTRARHCYEQWGALSKATHIEEQYL